jgi:hypothetical protein
MDPRVCHELRRRMEHPCDDAASTKRPRMPGGTGDASHRWHGRRGISHPVRTLSSLRAAADRVRVLVLRLDSDSPHARTPRAGSARSDGQPITRSSFSRPSLHQMAWKSVRSIARVRAWRGEGGGAAAAHHHKVWGNTDKPRHVSHDAASRAPAGPHRLQQLSPTAALQSSLAPAVRWDIPAEYAVFSASPVKCVLAVLCLRAAAGAAGAPSAPPPPERQHAKRAWHLAATFTDIYHHKPS